MENSVLMDQFDEWQESRATTIESPVKEDEDNLQVISSESSSDDEETQSRLLDHQQNGNFIEQETVHGNPPMGTDYRDKLKIFISALKLSIGFCNQTDFKVDPDQDSNQNNSERSFGIDRHSWGFEHLLQNNQQSSRILEERCRRVWCEPQYDAQKQ
ncbi:uncharacterized protein LOC144668886 isoform X2 [Cetorhinus maximus]